MSQHLAGWRKIPSATTGGKPYFYHLYDRDGHWQATVCWNRSVRAYAVEYLKRLENGIRTGTLLGYVSTVQAGKALIAKQQVSA